MKTLMINEDYMVYYNTESHIFYVYDVKNRRIYFEKNMKNTFSFFHVAPFVVQQGNILYISYDEISNKLYQLKLYRSCPPKELTFVHNVPLHIWYDEAMRKMYIKMPYVFMLIDVYTRFPHYESDYPPPTDSDRIETTALLYYHVEKKKKEKYEYDDVLFDKDEWYGYKEKCIYQHKYGEEKVKKIECKYKIVDVGLTQNYIVCTYKKETKGYGLMLLHRNALEIFYVNLDVPSFIFKVRNVGKNMIIDFRKKSFLISEKRYPILQRDIDNIIYGYLGYEKRYI